MDNDKIMSGKQNLSIPAHLNFGKYLLDRLRRMEDEIAIENGETGEKITYKEMVEYAVKLSMALTKLGVRKGDAVGLGTEKRIMILPTALAVVMSGAIYASYNITCGRAHLKHMIKITKPKYFICSDLFWKTHRETLLGCESTCGTLKTFISLDAGSEQLLSVSSLVSSVGDVDVKRFEPVTVQGQVDTAVVMYSSGTTGMPKGVRMSHLNCILYSFPHEPLFNEDVIKKGYLAGDWYHNYDTYMSLKLLSLGKTVVFTTDMSPETQLKAYEKTRVNLVLTIPSFVNLLSKTEMKQNENLDCLKYVFCGASPIHVKTMEKLKERFPSIIHVYQGYGMTESWELTSLTCSPKGPKMGSVGQPRRSLRYFEGKEDHPCVENPDTKEVLGPNQHGQICLKGPAFMKGYIDIDPSTYVDEKGWFRSGDLGYYDEDGYFYIVDRLKEIMDYDGNQVAPLELETILMLHPDVREAGVVGKPVPIFGEEPTAFVVRQPGSRITEQELVDFVAAEVEEYMQLRGGVRFVSTKKPKGQTAASASQGYVE